MTGIWEKAVELLGGQGGFDLKLAFTLLAYFTGGITGALIAMRRGYDIIGVLVVATVSAGGGSLIRDGVLLSAGPAGMLTDARYLVVVLAATLLTYVFQKNVHRMMRTIAVIDAIGLGAFAVHGVTKSLEAGLSDPAAILGGMVTSVGGGLLRDILVREEPLLFKPGQFYGLVAIGGCVMFVTLLRVGWISPQAAGLATVVTVFAFRMLAIRFNWRTTALYRGPMPPA